MAPPVGFSGEPRPTFRLLKGHLSSCLCPWPLPASLGPCLLPFTPLLSIQTLCTAPLPSPQNTPTALQVTYPDIQYPGKPQAVSPHSSARLFIQLVGAPHTLKEPCLKWGEVTKGDSFPSQKTGSERATGTLRSESVTLRVSQPLLPALSPHHVFSGTALRARFGGRLGDVRAGMAGR